MYLIRLAEVNGEQGDRVEISEGFCVAYTTRPLKELRLEVHSVGLLDVHSVYDLEPRKGLILMPYQPFFATTQMANADAVVDVIAVYLKNSDLPVMCILAPTGPIYITREQAMEFFGLVKPRIEIHYPLRKIIGNNDDQES